MQSGTELLFALLKGTNLYPAMSIGNSCAWGRLVIRCNLTWSKSMELSCCSAAKAVFRMTASGVL